jgi:fused signal recognition particle receptor
MIKSNIELTINRPVINMFSFLRKNNQSTDNVEIEEIVTQQKSQNQDIDDTAPTLQTEPELQKNGLFGRLKERLSRTSSKLTDGFSSLILGKKVIDEDLLEELETQLLTSDLGVDATQTIISDLTQRVARKQLGDAEALFTALRDDMVKILQPSCQPLVIPEKEGPYVILMVGINGVGKTTTIGKLAKQFQQQGKSVMLAAGDTFRAAAVEQLQVWGERNEVPVISQHSGADSASVIYDALQAAKARNIDILIADTAGRLHTQTNLMEELKKVTRVMAKLDDSAPHEVMLVLDAGTGQNALSQATQFNQAVGLTGITLTKLDGTAKGGIIFAIAKKTGLPIRYIGVGESIDDLRPFQADEFVDALLGREN